MAVREFDGSDDDIICDIGGLSAMQYGTVAALCKVLVSRAAWMTVFAPHESGGDSRVQLAFDSNDDEMIVFDETNQADFSDAALSPVTEWLLVVWRKPSGDVAPRFSAYQLTSQAWAHGDSTTGSIPDWDLPGADGEIRFSSEDVDFPDIRLAVRAAWSNSLPWSADASGDTALEAAGLETSAANWLDANPSAMWRYNQDSTATAVTDDTGGGADQTSITGTTVVNGDDPPGFSFDLAGTNLAAIAAYYQMLRSA